MSGFELSAIRKDKMHGFVAWFEVYFTHTHMATKISTSINFTVLYNLKALLVKRHIGVKQYFIWRMQ